MLERIKLSIEDFLKQNRLINDSDKLIQQINRSIIHRGDARKLEWIDDSSIDLVITSPPYLCAQDYIRTMRLYNFFPQIAILINCLRMKLGQEVKGEEYQTK